MYTNEYYELDYDPAKNQINWKVKGFWESDLVAPGVIMVSFACALGGRTKAEERKMPIKRKYGTYLFMLFGKYVEHI